MAKWQSFYKIVSPTDETTKLKDNQSLGTAGLYGNYSWYSKLIQGSSSRLTSYKEWDLMDEGDVEISRSLDTLAEEITGNNTKDDEILLLDFIESEEVENNIISTVNVALDHWVEIQDLENRMFHIARNTVKYGDVFFEKENQINRWKYIHPKNVMAAIVDKEDITKINGWQVRTDINETKSPYGGTGNNNNTEIKLDEEMIRFTLNDEMSDSAPFGESVLKSIYRVHKQKKLLEDSIIIYRITRAPERRVFYIDTGKMPPQRIKQYLEQIKNEINQKKIPTMNGGKNSIESIYNPQCLSLETEIPLLDGRKLSLNEIITEHNDGKEHWVYSIDPSTGKFKPGLVSWAGITRTNTDVIKVHLDNGESFVCTPDHRIPVQGKGSIEAKDLTVDDSLFQHKSKKVKFIKIEKVSKMDTGCITVDGEEIYHDYHNFAISAGIYVNNSMTEDFFLAQKADGKGSRIETLPGGQGLTALDDLEYFQNKEYRGLRIPSSFMRQSGENALFSDGKVGQAYIEELRFSLYVQRFQKIIERVLDREFKKYLKAIGINVDFSTFKVRLPEPSNFGKYKEQEMDAALLNNFSSLGDIPYLGKKFVLKRFLKLTDSEIAENERLKVKELGFDPDKLSEEEIVEKVYTVDDGMGGDDSGDLGLGGDLGDEMTPDDTEEI